MVKTAAVVLQFGIKTKMKTQSFGSSSWVKLLLEAFQRKRSLRICTKFAQMRQVAMWHIFCMRLIYYSPNNFKILPDPYPYQLLNTSVRNCFGMIQSVSTSAQVPSFQSVYLNWSQTKFAASNAGRHGKQSKSNCKTRNRRVSIPYYYYYIWVALSTLHWPSAKDKRWLRPNWRAPGHIDPYITVYIYIVYLAYSWGARYAVILYFYLLQ